MPLSPVSTESHTEPKDIVLDFLRALHELDTAAALDLVDEQIDYVNVSASRVRGKERLSRVFELGSRWSGWGFDVVIVNIVQEGDVVLTERFDTLRIGPVWTKFWVFGRFEVKNGKITVWRDYFDYLNVTLGLLRGMLGAAIPALRPKLTHQLSR